ncbi:hypothetical protein BD410DRAFT_139343 [Rickenella mellea]|uniref:Secreted protein n=1 Tax=Rickenella mellea TaxID=50990 RepID=A0A4Y7PI47_9AGAM|nr:hypothetical protein BD410DRAFT_139343 [Rickenella mellea]
MFYPFFSMLLILAENRGGTGENGEARACLRDACFLRRSVGDGRIGERDHQDLSCHQFNPPKSTQHLQLQKTIRIAGHDHG